MHTYLMCAWAERVHASVRTPGGFTGVREPGTPVGPGVLVMLARPGIGVVFPTVSPRSSAVRHVPRQIARTRCPRTQERADAIQNMALYGSGGTVNQTRPYLIYTCYQARARRRACRCT